MRRREFITLLGGAAAATWPLPARAQQAEQVRRIGVLMNMAADDPQGQARVTAFRQVLQQLGRSDRKVWIDTRWGENDVDRERQYAAELVTLAPDALLASGTVSVAALQKATAPCRSCSWVSLIRSAQGLSTAWPGRAAIPPALWSSNTVLAGNGWNSSRRSCPS